MKRLKMAPRSLLGALSSVDIQCIPTPSIVAGAEINSTGVLLSGFPMGI